MEILPEVLCSENKTYRNFIPLNKDSNKVLRCTCDGSATHFVAKKVQNDDPEIFFLDTLNHTNIIKKSDIIRLDDNEKLLKIM